MDENDAPRNIQRDLTLQEVADILRINRETARLWIQAGEFPNAYALPRGAGWRVPLVDLEALRERGRVQAFARTEPNRRGGVDRREEAG